MQQLTLNMRLQDGSRFDSFYCTSNNATLLNLLPQFPLNNPSPQQLLIYGDHFSGKSHLLQATCFSTQQQYVAAFYLPLKALYQTGPGILQGLNAYPLLCLDDIDGIVGDFEWEQALLELINKRFQQGRALILSSQKSPTEIHYELADLTAKLMWGAIYQLHPLEESDRIQAFQVRARQRGFDITPNVLRYIRKHCSHDLPTLLNILDKLDEESLIHGRQITIPFLKDILTQ